MFHILRGNSSSTKNSIAATCLVGQMKLLIQGEVRPAKLIVVIEALEWFGIGKEWGEQLLMEHKFVQWKEVSSLLVKQERRNLGKRSSLGIRWRID